MKLSKRRIDVHSHFLSREILDLLQRQGADYETPVVTTPEGKMFVRTPERLYGPIQLPFYDLDLRRQYMAEHGISTQLLVPPPFLFYYWLDPSRCCDIVRRVNAATASVVRDSDGAFLGLGTVSMLDARLAIDECERIKKAGLSGIVLGSNINNISLADERFWPVYEALESLKLSVLVHPANVLAQERMQDFHLKNLIGFPSDTTLMAAQLIFSGVLDRFPKLKISLGQAGGFLPYIIGRLDQGFTARPECREFISNKPSHYLRHFYYDTIIHAADPLAFLIQSVGPDRVMFGSDFPFDMQSLLPWEDARLRLNLDAAGLQSIEELTASDFLGLDAG